MRFIYLHGFASSPQSAKAQLLLKRFRSLNLPLEIPDLNQNDFCHLTLSRQIQQVQALFEPGLSANEPVTLIGSSFGGLTAAWLGDRSPQVQRLVLLAPAFQFLKVWLPRLGDAQHQQWQQTGSLMTYHYGMKQMSPLAYGFVRDLSQYDESTLKRSIPTLILHGRQDEVIPVQSSRDYAASHPGVKLVEFNSDHALMDVEAEMWQMIQAFCFPNFC